MLRNRSRAVTKQSQPIMPDHNPSSPSSRSSPTTPDPTRSFPSFLGSPSFFNGFFSPKNLSPTSILDTNKHVSNFGNNPFRFTRNQEKPRKIFEKSQQKSDLFDSGGIAIILVLDQETHSNNNMNICTKPNASTRKIMFGSKLKIQIPPLLDPFPNGSPDSPGDFGIKTRNALFSGAPTPTSFGSPRLLSTGPLSLKEMELSEEYTRVISYGPNPKTTHIYDNCVVNSCGGGGDGRVGSPENDPYLESFVSFCQTCKKNLDEGSDIFMYRGEKAFCSEECRCQEMILDGLINT